jgi:ABC-type transporter Mla MlaB component
LSRGDDLLSDVGKTTISFAGEVTISNIGQAHEQLAAALHEQQSLTVDIADVSETDLTFVQLLESARRKASETGVRLSLSKPATGSVLEVLQRGGFLDDATSDRATFWLQGAA